MLHPLHSTLTSWFKWLSVVLVILLYRTEHTTQLSFLWDRDREREGGGGGRGWRSNNDQIQMFRTRFFLFFSVICFSSNFHSSGTRHWGLRIFSTLSKHCSVYSVMSNCRSVLCSAQEEKSLWDRWLLFSECDCVVWVYFRQHNRFVMIIDDSSW